MPEKTKVKAYTMDMTEGPVLTKILMFSIPLMFSSVLQILFNAADIVVVGKFVGDTALAAVGSNSALINLVTNLFIGLSIGANVIVARYFGGKQDENTSIAVHTSIALGFISGIILTLIGIIGAPFFLRIMLTPEDVLPQAVLYLRILFAGITSMMLYNFGSAVLRAVGDTKRPLYFLLLAGIINVILNLFFVIVLKMSVAGVALATILSQALSCVLVLWCLTKEDSAIKLNFRKIRINKIKFIQILKIGLPAGFQGVVFALSNTVIQSSVNSFGSVVMAGSAAAQNIEGIVYFAMNSFYQASITFTSQCYGAKKFARINRVLAMSLLCVVAAGLICGHGLLFSGYRILGIFSSNSQVIVAGMNRLSVILSTYFLCGIMDVLVGALRGIGYSVLPMVVSLVGSCLLRLLWLATVFQMERFHTTTTVYLSYPISWAITLSVHAVCFAVLRRKLEDK
ncbi:MATE family efflux transporter [Treponema sp.]|uniref:MATE family efflux transporter n=1 Tax=Treponema sp. TaxID=166 RepID=UPI00298E186E|nr:MATE family efflux transporter [Treponema sp.]MCI7397953.1 MATE family efflux transporter [Spirochaetia bacterium]